MTYIVTKEFTLNEKTYKVGETIGEKIGFFPSVMKKVDEKEVPVDTGATTSPYDSYTKKDLAEFLTKNEVALTGKENKQELIALIETNGLDIKAGSTDA